MPLSRGYTGARLVRAGRPSAYLVDVESFESMQNKLHVLEGIVRGERALLENRSSSETEAEPKRGTWFDRPGRNPPFSSNKDR